MSLSSVLAEWFNPCSHQWEVVEKLRNDEKAPTAVKIIRGCTVCGKLDTLDVSLVTSCPPHRWEVTETVSVWDPKLSPELRRNAVPQAKLLIRTCKRCGEIESDRLTSDGIKKVRA